MIKSQKYSSKKTFFFLGSYEDSTLKAKLRFKKEVTPKDRKVIRERMVISYRDGKENLYTYLINEGFRAQGEIGYFDNPNAHVEICVETKHIRLGLDIEATSNIAMSPMEKMVNLEELNKFILTGKLPEKQS